MTVPYAAGEPRETGWRWWLVLEVVIWVAVGLFVVADEVLILATLADFWGSRILPGKP